MRPTLIQLRKRLRDALQKQKDEIGYNAAGLKFLRRAHEARMTEDFYAESMESESKVREKLASMEKKRKRVSIKG